MGTKPKLNSSCATIDEPSVNVAARVSLKILNISEATFDCTFGRGCDGKCCRNGRPPVLPDEADLIQENLARVRDFLRPEARKLIDREGFLSQRTKMQARMARVIGGWCVFFNEGCVLHKLGASEGDSYKYKPKICSMFPLEPLNDGTWYIRQQGYMNEDWDLECLHPKTSGILASVSVKDEIALAERLEVLKLTQAHKKTTEAQRHEVGIEKS